MEGNEAGLLRLMSASSGGQAANEAESAHAPAYLAGDLDQLLNDLQGNGLLVSDDGGLARLGEARLRSIRTAAMAEAAAAQTVELAWSVLARDAEKWSGTWVERVMAEHLRRLHEDGLRWRRLAEHAALYLHDRELARNRAGDWFAESRIKGEWPSAW